jgi:glycosyltransferase involved in cell wall biosynthesis
LSERGHSVTVYNRPSYYPDHPTRHRGMDLIYLPTIMSKSLETIVHTILSFLHALTQRFDVIYLCGVGNAPLAWMARLNGRKVLINTDGIDFRRRKWRGFARWWLRKSERMAVLYAHRVIVDNGEVAKHYKTAHRHTPECIPYGSTGSDGEGDDSLLEKWDLKPAEYILFVSRLTPENDAALLLEAYTELKVKLPLLLVGPIGYEERYKRELDALASPGVVFTGPVYGPGYRTLSRNCRFFVLPAAIEATRLVLLDQMGFGNAIVFRDVPATREVIADAGEPFDPNDSVGSLSRKMALLINQPERCKALGAAAKARATARFDWGPVTDRYEALFQQVMARRQRRRAEGGVRNEGNEERGRAAA